MERALVVFLFSSVLELGTVCCRLPLVGVRSLFHLASGFFGKEGRGAAYARRWIFRGRRRSACLRLRALRNADGADLDYFRTGRRMLEAPDPWGSRPFTWNPPRPAPVWFAGLIGS